MSRGAACRCGGGVRRKDASHCAAANPQKHALRQPEPLEVCPTSGTG